MLVRIAVTPDSKDSAKAIKETWGKRCNKVFFYTAEEGKPLIPVIRTPSKSAFGLLCDSIRNIVEEGEDFHWLLVTTETTFALPENLRYKLIQSLLSAFHSKLNRPYVAPLNSSKPYYLGHAMKFWNQVTDTNPLYNKRPSSTFTSQYNSAICNL